MVVSEIWRAGPGAAVPAALDERPHRRARRSQGWLDGLALVCPYHGRSFDGRGVRHREFGFDDERMAAIAVSSFECSAAPDDVRAAGVAGVRAWLAD